MDFQFSTRYRMIHWAIDPLIEWSNTGRRVDALVVRGLNGRRQSATCDDNQIQRIQRIQRNPKSPVTTTPKPSWSFHINTWADHHPAPCDPQAWLWLWLSFRNCNSYVPDHSHSQRMNTDPVSLVALITDHRSLMFSSQSCHCKVKNQLTYAFNTCFGVGLPLYVTSKIDNNKRFSNVLTYAVFHRHPKWEKPKPIG